MASNKDYDEIVKKYQQMTKSRKESYDIDINKFLPSIEDMLKEDCVWDVLESYQKDLSKKKDKVEDVAYYTEKPPITKLGYHEKEECFVLRANKFKVDKEMLNFWIEIINLLFEVGKKKGYSIEEIKISVAYYLIEIYNYLQMFDKAFEYMIIMIKNNSWVYLKDETLQWAKDKGKLWELKWEINWRVEYNANYIDTEEFKKYIEEVDKYE